MEGNVQLNLWQRLSIKLRATNRKYYGATYKKKMDWQHLTNIASWAMPRLIRVSEFMISK
jgi:hypothetical protein